MSLPQALASAGSESSGKRPKRQRRTLSCLPCRQYKLRCNRAVPCDNCCRHGRQERCRLNPPPEAAMAPRETRGASSMRPRLGTKSPAPLVPQVDIPPTPSSVVEGESFGVCEASPIDAHHLERSTGPPLIPHPLHSPPFTNNTLGGVTVASAIISRSANPPGGCLLDEPASYWKHYLVSLLPSQTQCDMLVAYFFENINWVYRAIHAPSFRNEYTAFWATDVDSIDLVWLALLYMVLCLGGLFVPSQVAEAVGFDASDLPMLYRRWYSASRHALHAGGHDSKPTVTAIQIFLISQLYWYGTKNVEALNSHMGQAVRNAQALGLDKEASQSTTNCVEREMRHRIWWDLVSSDTFQSLCLDRPTLLQAHLSNVPFPSNCNDVDITPTAIKKRPISEPTEMSVHCFRSQIFKVFNRLYVDNGAKLSSYAFTTEIDAQVTAIMDRFPWYMKDDAESLQQHLSPGFANIMTWMRHILQSAICIQRVRMYRPFLNPVVGDAWVRCVAAGTSALAVYKSLRAPNTARFQRSQKMHVQSYQIFSAAVALATFLLVEMPSNASGIRADVELVIEDLHSHSMSVDDARWIPLVSDGGRLIRRILRLYDARCKRNNSDSMRSAGSGEDPPSQEDEAPTALVPAISSVFGGESSARRYLERCSMEFIFNDADPAEDGAGSQGQYTNVFELAAWDALLDPAQFGQWNDAFWADLDARIGLNPDSS